MNWLYVFIGGGLGSIARYGLGHVLKDLRCNLPLSTFTANLFAALMIGVLYFSGVKARHDQWWLLLATGFCGGLSTFSAFSLETLELFRNGSYIMAVLNIVLSVTCCLVLIWALSFVIKQNG
jgi:CrcB protein